MFAVPVTAPDKVTGLVWLSNYQCHHEQVFDLLIHDIFEPLPLQ